MSFDFKEKMSDLWKGLAPLRKKVANAGIYCWNVIRQCSKFYVTDKLGAQSVALTYYTIFAIVPLVALAFGFAKGFGLDERLRSMIIARFGQYNQLLEKVLSFIDTTLENASGGVVAGIGVLILLGVAIKMIYSIEATFNDIWKQPYAVNSLSRFCSNVLLFILLPFFLIFLSGVSTVVDAMVARFEIVHPNLSFFSQALLYMFPLCLTIAVFFLIYMVVPDAKPRFWPVFTAACLAAVTYLLFQEFFIWAQKSIYNYNKVYGGFSAIPLSLIWMSFAWQIILVGAELSYVINEYEFLMLDKEDDCSTLSILERQLSVVAQVYAAHHRKQGAVSVEKLKEILKLTRIEVMRDVQGLVAAKLVSILETKDDTAVVATLPETTTIIEAFERLLSTGRPVNGKFSHSQERIPHVLTLFCQHCKKMPENSRLYEFARPEKKSSPAADADEVTLP